MSFVGNSIGKSLRARFCRTDTWTNHRGGSGADVPDAANLYPGRYAAVCTLATRQLDQEAGHDVG